MPDLTTMWTTSEDALLRERYPLGGPSQCASCLDRTPTSVRTRAYKLGVKRARRNAGHVKLRPQQKAEAVEWYLEGESAVKIAAKFGVKCDCVYNVLRAAGVKRSRTGQRNSKWSTKEEAALTEAYLAGATQPQLAEKFGRSQGNISYTLKRLGVKTRYQRRVFTEEEIAEILARYKVGETAASIAKGFGVFHKRVLSIIDRHQIKRHATIRCRWTDCCGRKITFRSLWEVGVAKWLDVNGRSWDYEVERYTVQLPDKSSTYKPDFWVYGKDGDLVALIDVKGRSWPKQREKIEAFREQYPNLPFEVWDAKKLHEIGVVGCEWLTEIEAEIERL